jgi:hypothetical protein
MEIRLDAYETQTKPPSRREHPRFMQFYRWATTGKYKTEDEIRVFPKVKEKRIQWSGSRVFDVSS